MRKWNLTFVWGGWGCLFVATLSQFPEFKELMPEQSQPPGPELKRKSLWTPCLCVLRGCTLDVFFRIAAIKGKRSSMLWAPNLSLRLFWKCPNGLLLVNSQRRGSILQALSNWEFAFPFAMSCLSNIYKCFFFIFSLPPEPARRKQPMPVHDFPWLLLHLKR